MSDQNKGNVNGGDNGGKNPKKGFLQNLKQLPKRAWVWLTTSKAGNVTLGLTTAGAAAFGMKTAYDKGFKNGAASVTPTTVYIQAGVDDDEEDDIQEPEEDEPESVEETAE